MAVLGMDDIDHSGFVALCTVNPGQGHRCFARPEEGIRICVDSGEVGSDAQFLQSAAYRFDFLPCRTRIGVDDHDVVVAQFVLQEVLGNGLRQPVCLFILVSESDKPNQVVEVGMVFQKFRTRIFRSVKRYVRTVAQCPVPHPVTDVLP